MDLISEERRKEMEEEMNRFELEILGPGEEENSSPSRRSRTVAPLSPPPAPPVVALIPKILTKPPPPPPSISPPSQPPLRPPPRPPHFQAPHQQAPRFIPAQVQRQPPRHHGPRGPGNFMGMRGPPGPFHHQHHHHQGPPMGHHFGPPMGPGHMHPGDEMHFRGPMMHGPMHPGPMMPMNMGVNLPMPPGFCPPGPPMGQQRYESQFDGGNHNQQQNMEPPPSNSTSSNDNPAVVASAPTIYSAPFKKTKTETTPSSTQPNGKEGIATTGTASLPVTIKTERVPVAKPTPEPTVGPVGVQGSEDHPAPSKKKEKKKKIVRMAGGQAWEDNSLLEWDTDDFRIFCGDLGNDVTDEVLIRAFSKYPSFVKAKVVRDKRTNKTKGFGFVSFKDPQDFIKAMREMNGRYVGSRPIKLRKSTWRDRNIDIVKKKQREKEKLGLL